jgi:hypothetical protein
MTKIKVVISGYPKSGNTWITRLVAELLQCPVYGFWMAPENYQEIACEGKDRISQFECYKSHHSFKDFKREFKKSNDIRLINIVRDPRDIAISGSNFFLLEKSNMLAVKRLLSNVSPGQKLYRILLKTLKGLGVNPSVYSYEGNARLDKMVETLIGGNKDFNRWLIPWRDHVTPYLDNDVFLIKYELMLSNPELECVRILNYLELERTEKEIQKAIESQSFDKVKQKFLRAKDYKRSNFLKIGQPEKWRLGLNQTQKLRFAEIEDVLTRLNYPRL